jgi:tetratricopeptide (TPR) repeat protein
VCLAVRVTDHVLTQLVLDTWDFSDPAASQARFEKAAADGADPVRRQVFLTQVARAYGLQEAYDAGHDTLDTLGAPDTLADEPAVRSLLERGRLRNSAGDKQAAVPLFRAAYDRAVAAGLTGLAVDAAHMLAIALPPEEHPAWVERGLALADGSDDPLARSMAVALLNNLGWTYADADRWPEALDVWERALVAARERGKPWPVHVARWTVARALRALGRHEEALAILHELAATDLGADDEYVAEEIAANETALA